MPTVIRIFTNRFMQKTYIKKNKCTLKFIHFLKQEINSNLEINQL